MAAAGEMWRGKLLYTEIWYDKPPLAAAFYMAVGKGWTLRLAGALFSLCSCMVSFCFARDLFGKAAGLWAAGLLAFFLIFDLPVAVIPIGPDMLMLPFNILAVYLAWSGRVFWAGTVAGVAFFCNAKALFVLAACTLFGAEAIAGFVVPLVIGGGVLWLQGVWTAYLEQVWIWSSAYAGSTFVQQPLRNGVLRTLSWIGFHSGLCAGLSRHVPWRLLAWLAISFVAVGLGWRFFPRYYLQVLPAAVILASGGLVRWSRWRYVVLLLLLIPMVRFGRRYVSLALHGDAEWADTAMDRDSREAGALVKRLAHTGDSMFVWGYRPEVWIYAALPAATRYLDCQALTGVPADRHLTNSVPVTERGTRAARASVAQSRPEFVLDGLTAFNPGLSMNRYPELGGWMSGYREVAHTRSTVIYRRIPVR